MNGMFLNFPTLNRNKRPLETAPPEYL